MSLQLVPQPSSDPEPVQSPSEIKAQQFWQTYCDFANQWFFEPDLQAVEIVLAALTAQFNLSADPVWLFVIGPSGGGKTSLCIYPMLGISNTYLMGDLTSKTFLSAYTGTKNASLLSQIGSSGILLFKDFTTFLSKRQDERSAIAAQLREIYDGTFNKNTGKGTPIPWQGKLTVVAAATQALERYWALHKEFGERFMTVRWERRDGIKVAEMARKQVGREPFIKQGLKVRIDEMFKLQPAINIANPPELTDEQSLMLSSLAEFTALSRTQVAREGLGNRQIIDIPQPEENTRPGKALSTLSRYHAAFFRSPVVRQPSLHVAARIAIDSIPLARARIILSLPKQPDKVMSTYDLCEATRMNDSTFKWNVEELEVLGVVKQESTHGGENVYSLTRKMLQLWEKSFGHALLS